jgi:Leucine-rich repeat (LRR) protein
LTTLKASWFLCLENLECLELRSNGITNIDDAVLVKLIKLEELNLVSNRLITIKSNWFKCLESLKCLGLDSNEITRIDDDAFVKLNKLEEINLDSNKLKII